MQFMERKPNNPVLDSGGVGRRAAVAAMSEPDPVAPGKAGGASMHATVPA
jgi:hypothetical protein